MRKLTRIFFILGLLWLEIVLYGAVVRLQAQENADGTQIVMLFGGIIFVAIVIGCIAALWIIPAIGETVGNFFFNPNQQIEKNPHSDALAKIAQGDYEAAIEEYKKNLEANPDDMHAFSEIIHLYCDKLHDHDAAEHFLEEALKNEWPPEQGAFIASRLVDVYWNHKGDATRARHVLMQIAETMPDTRHSANAVHRLHEIERALANQAAGIVRPPSLTGEPEQRASPDETEAHGSGDETETRG
jgi:tetratricopeptide (TPR) repeat protein